METPVFEEFDPVSDCDCPGCRHWRRVLPHSPAGRAPAHPAAHRVLVVTSAVAAATALGAVPAAAAPAAQVPGRPGVPAGDEPGTPQGPRAPLHGPGGAPAGPSVRAEPLPATTREEIIDRAGKWVTEKVPYSTSAYRPDGYRQDCSGFVSMAWKLPRNEWTGTLGRYADRISKEELEPGDILLFHNPADPWRGSHVVIFGGWTDPAHTVYRAYEQTRPHTREWSVPYAYWRDSARYLPYRYKGLTASTPGGAPAAAGAPGAASSDPAVHPASHGVPGYPGRAMFRPGASNVYVTRLGRRLVEKGFGKHYTTGPGPRWGEADRRNVEAFQRAQGWRGGAADGYPGPETWRRLFS
ncbi:peptidoglycan-binding protein [Streptomyces sp. TRM S81-3]|uniref:Peptidoglycan-binding protein n=1 Tax=Streptomyces griseicoloratus TaxID=2752516 RepID=A0A926QS77_9ACTN|nr:peptidoglycan-binding protein [Streptomyces griseicoloratus]MBD0420712.1 peptidoglycan-binding protein [Streptomyces griseicoloratus]